MQHTKTGFHRLAARIEAVIDRAISGNRIVGTVTLLSKGGEIRYARAAGMADRESGDLIARDTIFRYASLTKPIVAVAALRMHEAGVIEIDAPVHAYLPEFRPRLPDGTAPAISLRDLLRHTGGLATDITPTSDELAQPRFHDVQGSHRHLSLAENLTRLAALPLLARPGSLWAYGLSLDVLGAVVAAAHGAQLPEAIAEWVTGPASMPNSAFNAVDPQRLAVPYADGPEGAVRMLPRHTLQHPAGHFVTFTPDRILDPDVYPSGGSGMAGTADDFMRFLLRLQDGTLLSDGMLEEATRDQLPPGCTTDLAQGMGFGLIGAVLNDAARRGTPQNAGTYSWSGVFGNHWFVDPAAGISLVCLTNTAFEGCNGAFTAELRDAIYAD